MNPYPIPLFVHKGQVYAAKPCPNFAVWCVPVRIEHLAASERFRWAGDGVYIGDAGSIAYGIPKWFDQIRTVPFARYDVS